MSFCRFSDNNWKSDVYAYESAEGFELHVASKRVVGEVPAMPRISDIPSIEPGEFLRAHQAQHAFLETAERVPIGGPHDGESFRYPTLGDLYNALLELRFDGYHVPEFALEGIREELGEENDETPLKTNEPRRKRAQLRHLRRRHPRTRPAPDATAVSEGRGKK